VDRQDAEPPKPHIDGDFNNKQDLLDEMSKAIRLIDGILAPLGRDSGVGPGA
jgi:hypothetical protein